MFLKSLSLTNFKNHAEVQFTFNEKVNCIVGKNGSGKTNLLDAIHYLCFCKSYFSHQDISSIRFEADFFAIHGIFADAESQPIKVSCTYKNGRKVMKAHNKEYERFSDHIGLFPLIMVSPYDNDIINEGSEQRRRFFDIAISQYDKEYLACLIQYQKALAQRNFLLKQSFQRTIDPSLLYLYNEQMKIAGSYIFEKRREYINEVLPDIKKYYAYLASDEEVVDVTYHSQLVEEDFDSGFQKMMSQDLKLGYSCFGIHKDDFIFTINQKSVKKFASQGQQKSFSLSLKLSQYDYIRSKSRAVPILLLDDIFDKLDRNRINRLLNLVGEKHFQQVFITDTDEERVSEILETHHIEGQIFNVSLR